AGSGFESRATHHRVAPLTQRAPRRHGPESGGASAPAAHANINMTPTPQTKAWMPTHSDQSGILLSRGNRRSCFFLAGRRFTLVPGSSASMAWRYALASLAWWRARLVRLLLVQAEQSLQGRRHVAPPSLLLDSSAVHDSPGAPMSGTHGAACRGSTAPTHRTPPRPADVSLSASCAMWWWRCLTLMTWCSSFDDLYRRKPLSGLVRSRASTRSSTSPSRCAR